MYVWLCLAVWLCVHRAMSEHSTIQSVAIAARMTVWVWAFPSNAFV